MITPGILWGVDLCAPQARGLGKGLRFVAVVVVDAQVDGEVEVALWWS